MVHAFHAGHITTVFRHTAVVHAHAGHGLMAVAVHQRLHTQLIQLRVHHQLQPALLDPAYRRYCGQFDQAVRHALDTLRQRRLNMQYRQRLVERGQRHAHLFNRQRNNIERLAVGGIHQHFKAFAHQHRQFGQLDRLGQKAAVAGDHVERPIIAGCQIQ
ncbi:hypothetical protein D3C78_965920 [compost metagenome]